MAGASHVPPLQQGASSSERQTSRRWPRSKSLARTLAVVRWLVAVGGTIAAFATVRECYDRFWGAHVATGSYELTVTGDATAHWRGEATLDHAGKIIGSEHYSIGLEQPGIDIHESGGLGLLTKRRIHPGTFQVVQPPDLGIVPSRGFDALLDIRRVDSRFNGDNESFSGDSGTVTIIRTGRFGRKLVGTFRIYFSRAASRGRPARSMVATGHFEF